MKLHSTHLALIVVLPGFLCRCSQPAGEDRQANPAAYLTSHRAAVDPFHPDRTDELDLMKEDLSHEVFLAGETHEVKGNNEVAVKLFKYLHRYANVRYYLLELPHSYARMYNKALRSDTLVAGMDRDPFFVSMHRYYHSLPEDNRFEFIGVDIERISWAVVPELKELLPVNDSLPEILHSLAQEVEAVHNQLVDIMSTTYDLSQLDTPLEQMAERLHGGLQTHPEDFAQVLGEDHFDFKVIVTNLLNHQRARWNEGEGEAQVYSREQAMYETFLAFHPRLEGAVFGQWGSMHVRQDTSGMERMGDSLMHWSNPHNFAWSLQHRPGSPVKGKVLSIGYNYRNCLTHQHQRAHHEAGVLAHSILPEAIENLLTAHALGDFTLFRLNAKGTPFPELSSDFQYILHVQNQR